MLTLRLGLSPDLLMTSITIAFAFCCTQDHSVALHIGWLDDAYLHHESQHLMHLLLAGRSHHARRL